jgi:hypothetical protein
MSAAKTLSSRNSQSVESKSGRSGTAAIFVMLAKPKTLTRLNEAYRGTQDWSFEPHSPLVIDRCLGIFFTLYKMRQRSEILQYISRSCCCHNLDCPMSGNQHNVEEVTVCSANEQGRIMLQEETTLSHEYLCDHVHELGFEARMSCAFATHEEVHHRSVSRQRGECRRG